LEAAIAAVGVPLTLQEYVSDTTIVSCAAVRVDGQLLGLTHARYIRTYPSQRGSAALATTVAPPRSLTERVEKLLSLIGWCGIFELELLERGEDQFNASDFNPRPFGRMALAIGVGANLPALSCDHVCRRRNVSPGRARVGNSCRWEDAGARNALEHLRPARLCSAAAVLRPRMRVVHAHFRIDDPRRRCSRGCSQWRRRRAEGASEAKPTLEQPAHYLELGRPIIGQHRASWMPYAAYHASIPCPRI
jgi:hypothetical protein